MATAFAITVRSHTLTIGNNLYNAKAEAISDGIVRYLIVQMLRPDSANSANRSDGSASLCSWADIADVSYRIQDQGGLVDVNTANPVLLQKLFSGLRLDAVKQDALLDSLKNYKAPSSLSNFGSPQHYPSKNFGPKNQPLLSLDELDQVPGFSSEILKRIRPLMTVYSQQTGIDPSRAPAGLLKILGSMRDILTMCFPVSSTPTRLIPQLPAWAPIAMPIPVMIQSMAAILVDIRVLAGPIHQGELRQAIGRVRRKPQRKAVDMLMAIQIHLEAS